MFTFNITFNAYDEYMASVLTGTFKTFRNNPSPQDIKNAVNRILLENNWGAASVRIITVYKA